MPLPLPPDLLKQVKRLELTSRGLVSALFAGEARSVFRGQGMEFAEVRQYEAGDDIRAIDWNVSARLGTPYVKTFTEERELTVFLLVDQSGSTRVGEPVSKVAREVEIGAVLALAAAGHQDRVGALLFTDRVEHVVPPAKGRRHALRVIRDMLAFAPQGRGTDLAASLTYARRLLRHRSIVVVLSDFMAEGWERPLRQLAARHDVVAIVLDAPSDARLPAEGWIEVEDAETGQRVLVNAAAQRTRTRLAREVVARRERRSQMFAAAGVDELHLATDADYAQALRRTFAARARRRGPRG